MWRWWRRTSYSMSRISFSTISWHGQQILIPRWSINFNLRGIRWWKESGRRLLHRGQIPSTSLRLRRNRLNLTYPSFPSPTSGEFSREFKMCLVRCSVMVRRDFPLKEKSHHAHFFLPCSSFNIEPPKFERTNKSI